MAGSVNKVILVGNLGKDPDVRRMTSGEPVVNLSVATSESWRDKQSGERKERTEWHRVVIFNENLAKVAEQYLRKGSKVYLEGQLQTRKYSDKDGHEKYSTEVVLQRFRGELVMLDARGEGGGASASRGGGGSSDAPASFERGEMDDEIRSEHVPVRMRVVAVLTLVLGIAACARSAGEPSAGFVDPLLTAAYLPLAGKAHIILDARAAATVVAPGVAVTNAHNANLVADDVVIGVSRDYDLLFFRTTRAQPPSMAKAWIGEMVIAYGQGKDGELRQARGIVRSLDAPVEARCPSCPIQQVLTFEAGAGEGFSGGPVADAANGRLVGIVFGYNDLKDGSRLMYGYDMARISAELSKVVEKPAQTAAQHP